MQLLTTNKILIFESIYHIWHYLVIYFYINLECKTVSKLNFSLSVGQKTPCHMFQYHCTDVTNENMVYFEVYEN